MGVKRKIEEDPYYEARCKIALEAFNSGCLIFPSDTGKFYTPREFVESHEKVLMKQLGMKEYNNFTLHYPAYAIGRKMADMRKAISSAEEDFESFMKRLMNAFDISPRQNNKNPDHH